MTTNLAALITEIMQAPNRQDIRKALIAYLQQRDAATFTTMEAYQFTELLDQHAHMMQVSAEAFDIMTPAQEAA